jgi:threonine aldolase
MVDLYSDTVTRPSPEMRRFMMDAEVGDEQRGLDRTVNQLQEMVAELLGKEAALFLPSGTMCNQVAFGVHCRPGDEIIMDDAAHPFNYEAGGPAALFGTLIRPISGEQGLFTTEQLVAAIRPKAYFNPRSRVVSVEQTTNYTGGICWPLDAIRAVCEKARERGLLRHMDGARLMNAVVATGTKAADFAAPFDSVWIDLSKGLGCPVGAVLAGSREFIEEAWALKHRLGGAMRQAGIIAAAGIYALKHNIDRLADDHANARLLAEGLASVKGITLDPRKIQTNIVIFDVAATGKTAVELATLLEGQGVSFSPAGPTLLRAVTHLDVNRDDVTFALGVVEKAIH